MMETDWLQKLALDEEKWIFPGFQRRRENDVEVEKQRLMGVIFLRPRTEN